MSLWYDLVDWLGGWPFEVSRPDDVVREFGARGFRAAKVLCVGNRPGCNEFVFERRDG
jgi:2-polyprenyl-6-hydroxyphenyl methylase/3-demethylubiquinone-9 3-methyltransferase